ncbi:translation initiation factor 2D [Clonorchis sinensis]|uniref:Translation initiation factor 2D n=1 Tax=Clonorchis sinensis TaxID=79923 RepID=G7Y967_CLOSI|nr:translation initiation factor 2D [Clonorchis sinensis]
MSSYDMFMSGGRGKVVSVYHIIGDNICSLGPPVSRPLLVHPSHSSVSQEKLGDEAATASGEESQLPLHVSVGDLEIGQDDAVDMDDLLRCSFLRALKLLKDKQLPMPVNVFYAQHLLTQNMLCLILDSRYDKLFFRPPTINLDIKKTSYKKVSVFLKAMQDQGLVSLTESQPGILTLTSVNHDHDALCNVKALNEPNNSVPSKTSTNDWPPGYHGPPHIEEVRIITGPSSALFSQAGYGPNACIPQSEVRKVVDQYVRQRGLQRKDDPSLVQLDPLLMKFCNPNMYLEATESTLANPVYLMRFQQLFSCTLQQLPLAYRISPAEGAGPPSLWRKKHPPVIDLTVVMKNGKKLTRVSNLETFTIDPDAFAKRLQLTLACSAGRVEDPQHRDTITIQAQGSHEAAVSKILTETYGIHKRYIKGYIESTKPKGRK